MPRRCSRPARRCSWVLDISRCRPKASPSGSAISASRRYPGDITRPFQGFEGSIRPTHEIAKEAGMDERDLIRRAQAGDATAFGELLDSHYDTIFRFAWRWSRHRANAEDIAQLACMKLANSLAQYRFEAAFATWLYRLVISCAQDWKRSQQRHEHDELFETAALTDGSQTEDQIYLAQLLLELEDLGQGMKETALLVHAEGMSHAEAGAVLGVSESTISWRVHTIRRHMGKREARISV